jgi:hypothetical protein
MSPDPKVHAGRGNDPKPDNIGCLGLILVLIAVPVTFFLLKGLGILALILTAVGALFGIGWLAGNLN